MAARWMKSLQCKSTAADDVVSNNHRPFSRSSSCKNKVQSIIDVVEPGRRKPPKNTHSAPASATWNEPGSLRLLACKPVGDSIFPALTELPIGHPSRNVVEIIFHTSWGQKGFGGQIELVFKVQNPNRTVNRFEEYREMVKSWARSSGAADGRCVADGNEVMRFYCLGATAGAGACDVGRSAWPKGSVVSTYAGSGAAHSRSGGGMGRRAMMVCRVISGRVFEGTDHDGGGYESACGNGGELVVFDSRAVLPCFLIIYNL